MNCSIVAVRPALLFTALCSVPRPNSAPRPFCAAFFLPQPLYWHHSYSNGAQQEQNQSQAAHKSSVAPAAGPAQACVRPRQQACKSLILLHTHGREDRGFKETKDPDFNFLYWRIQTCTNPKSCFRYTGPSSVERNLSSKRTKILIFTFFAEVRGNWWICKKIYHFSDTIKVFINLLDKLNVKGRERQKFTEIVFKGSFCFEGREKSKSSHLLSVLCSWLQLLCYVRLYPACGVTRY